MVIEHKSAGMERIEAIHIRLEGYIDHDTCIDFEESLAAFLQKGKKFILLECRNLKYISDAGIGALITVSRNFEKNKACLVFYDFPDELSKVIQFLNLSQSLLIAKNKKQALRILKKCSSEYRKENVELTSVSGSGKEENLEPSATATSLPSEQIPFEELVGEQVDLKAEMEQIGVLVDEREKEDTARPGKEEHGLKEIVDQLFVDKKFQEDDAEKNKNQSYRVIECSHCSQLSKISAPGTYSCPRCLKEFTMDADGKIIWNKKQ